MKRYLLLLLLIAGALVPSISAIAQQRSTIGPNAAMPMPRTSAKMQEPRGGTASKHIYQALGNHQLPVSISAPGFDMINVQSNTASAAYQQSNGRSLHNIQVDPMNPMHIHALMQGMQNTSDEDTVGLYSRRLYYTYSADGGHTWSNPVTLGDKRTGYGDLLLYNRGGQYVALVVGHTVTNAAASNAMVSVWLEKGAPGDGNFSQTVTGVQDIIWPTGAISKDGSTLYVIASRQATTAGTLDQLQFGTFTINAEAGTTKWNGWSALPGDNELNPDAGKTTGGEYRIHVADDGRIGVAWHNDVTDPRDQSIYYSESIDGGATWSGENMTTVAMLSDPDDQGYQWWPTGSFDFWYEGHTPRFVWVQVPENFDASFYQPYNTTLVYWSPTSGADPDTVATADPTSNRENPIPSSLAVISEPGDLQFDHLIGYPTVARFVSKNFAVFYTGFQSGNWMPADTGTDDQLGPDTLMYSSIFYSATHDGGVTWDAPKEFATNSGAGASFDYRYPSTSYFNEISGANGTAHVLVEIDTAAGTLIRNGWPGFGAVTFGHKAAVIGGLGVKDHAPLTLSLEQNFPNPFKPSTQISFSLTNPSSVVLTVEDVMGRPIATVANSRFGSGPHTINFDAKDLPSGAYRYTLRANGEVVSKTMTLLK